jgi:hypothetical protein
MLSDRLRELEAKQDEITERMVRPPVNLPDVHPNVADIYRRKVARLADALNHPEDRHEAADALRGLIERIVLTPGPKPRQLGAVLHGELGSIVKWVARTGKAGQKNAAFASVARVSESVNARARPAHPAYGQRRRPDLDAGTEDARSTISGADVAAKCSRFSGALSGRAWSRFPCSARA